MPARWNGASAQKSASQRLCAWRPAQRSAKSAALGGGAVMAEAGKNGGTVLGNTTSPTMPSAASSRRRRALSQFWSASGPSRSPNGLTNVGAQASKSSCSAAGR